MPNIPLPFTNINEWLYGFLDALTPITAPFRERIALVNYIGTTYNSEITQIYTDCQTAAGTGAFTLLIDFNAPAYSGIINDRIKINQVSWFMETSLRNEIIVNWADQTMLVRWAWEKVPLS